MFTSVQEITTLQSPIFSWYSPSTSSPEPGHEAMQVDSFRPSPAECHYRLTQRLLVLRWLTTRHSTVSHSPSTSASEYCGQSQCYILAFINLSDSKYCWCILWLCHWYCDFSICSPQIGVSLQFHLRGALPQTHPPEKNPWLFVQGPLINWSTLKSRNHSLLCRTHQPTSWSVKNGEYCAYLAHSPFICHILVHWRHPEVERTMLSRLLPVPKLPKNAEPAIPMDLCTTSIESPIKQWRTSVEIPPSYSHFQDVLCPQRATQLPPHRPWDCAIDLLLGETVPCWKIYPLSLSEQKTMVTSIHCPSIYLPGCFKRFFLLLLQRRVETCELV